HRSHGPILLVDERIGYGRHVRKQEQAPRGKRDCLRTAVVPGGLGNLGCVRQHTETVAKREHNKGDVGSTHDRRVLPFATSRKAQGNPCYERGTALLMAARTGPFSRALVTA